jgi:hypothetical protein
MRPMLIDSLFSETRVLFQKQYPRRQRRSQWKRRRNKRILSRSRSRGRETAGKVREARTSGTCTSRPKICCHLATYYYFATSVLDLMRHIHDTGQCVEAGLCHHISSSAWIGSANVAIPPSPPLPAAPSTCKYSSRSSMASSPTVRVAQKLAPPRSNPTARLPNLPSLARAARAAGSPRRRPACRQVWRRRPSRECAVGDRRAQFVVQIFIRHVVVKVLSSGSSGGCDPDEILHSKKPKVPSLYI